MSNEEIIQNNKLLADFIGVQVTDFQWKDWKTLIIGDEEDAMDFGELQYYTPNKDWNQLMVVIDAIKCCSVEEYTLIDDIDDALICIEIGDTWKACVEFCKWYKENKND